jgi:hypothetical protein
VLFQVRATVFLNNLFSFWSCDLGNILKKALVYSFGDKTGFDFFEIVLGIGNPLLGSKPVPFHGSLIILRNTLSVVVHHTQIELGSGIPLFRSKFPPLRSSLIVLGNTLSFAVHQTQIELGIGIPLFRKRCPFTQSSCEITTIVCGKTLLEILAPRHFRTSKKQGNGEADGGGQVSHTERLTENIRNE